MNKSRNRQFAVIGLGRFGTSVVQTLFNLGYDVLAIDKNGERVQKFSEEATHVVQADTTDENALKALGIRNFDVVVVAIGEDTEASVLTAMLLQDIGVRYVVAKAHNALHGRMLQKVGVQRVVYPERDMGQRVARNLVSTNVLDYIELSPNFSLVEVTLPKLFIGKTLTEVDLRAKYGVNVLAIKRGDEIILTSLANQKMQDGDVLIIVGGNNSVQRLEQLE